MPSGQNYQPVLSGKWTNNQFLASLQNLALAYAVQQGITMPIGPNFTPALAGTWTDNQFLASLQNIWAAILAGGGGGSGSANVQGGSVALVSGQITGYTASFGAPFGITPKLAFGFIKSGINSNNVGIAGYTVTPAGFTFDLTGDPGAGAALNYVATSNT